MTENMNKLNDIFPYKNKKWKITEIHKCFTMKDGKQVEANTASYYCRNIRKDGSFGGYYLKISFHNKEWKLPSGLDSYNSNISYTNNPASMRDYQPKFVGEYDNVCKYTTQYENLKEAHETSITPERAMEVIEILCKRFNVSFKNGTWKISDDVGAGRGWGGHRYKGSKRIPYLSVSAKDLTLGTILHEFAHVLHRNRWRQIKDRQAHGRAFIDLLDKIVEYYYEAIENNYKIAANKGHHE